MTTVYKLLIFVWVPEQGRGAETQKKASNMLKVSDRK
jgi:hypothetical protein